MVRLSSLRVEILYMKFGVLTKKILSFSDWVLLRNGPSIRCENKLAFLVYRFPHYPLLFRSSATRVASLTVADWRPDHRSHARRYARWIVWSTSLKDGLPDTQSDIIVIICTHTGAPKLPAIIMVAASVRTIIFAALVSEAMENLFIYHIVSNAASGFRTSMTTQWISAIFQLEPVSIF